MTAVITSLLLIGCPTEDPVRVTVVIILATTQDSGIDPKLAELAKEVRKRNELLLGFRIKATDARSIPIGEGHTFELVDKEVLRVRVEKSKDEDGRISLTIKPPGLDKITYGCSCGKFFPVVTPHETKDGEVLIIAIMAKPCMAGKKATWFPWRD